MVRLSVFPLALVAAALVAAPALAVTEWALAESRHRIDVTTTATAERSATAGAQEVAARVLRVRSALASAAQGLLVQYGAARKDKDVLGGILADLRPLIGVADDVRVVFVIDQAGEMLAADPPPSSISQAAMVVGAWSAEARAGRPAVSAVYAPPGGMSSVVVAVPVRDGFGQAAGALAAVIDLSRAHEWLGPLATPGATVRITDARGGAIAGTPAAAGSGFASADVAGLGWRVEVAPPALRDSELEPAGLALRALVLGLALTVFITAVLLGRSRARAQAAGIAGARERGEIAAAGRQRALFLDRFGQSLRTPLNSIVGFSGLLEEQLADTGFAVPERRWLRNIRAETAQLVSLTSDACDLSLFDSGDVELRRREIGIGELMAPVAQTADADAAEREITVAHDVQEAVVSLDVERVRRVASALVDRAIRRAAPGSSVVVTARPTSEGFELSVESAGTGLPAERISAVREALAGLPDTSAQPGAGLSLAVAARTAALHGGSISYAESDARTGSFLVRIPNVA